MKYTKTLGVERGDRVVWGRIRFCNSKWELLPEEARREDSRYRQITKRMRRVPPLYKMSASLRGDWGAVYAVATKVVRRCGGHQLDVLGYRGSDARLGVRFRQMGLHQILCSDPRFTTLHRGSSWLRVYRSAGMRDTIRNNTRSPNINMTLKQLPPIANGGLGFWNSDWFRDAYEMVYVK